MIQRFESSQALADALAQSIAQSLRAAIAARGVAHLAVSGGKTPAALFAALSLCELAWSQAHIHQVDERLVDSAHADSNSHLQRSTLLQNHAAVAQFSPLVFMQNKLPVLSIATTELAINSIVNDVVQLGMGDDGHFASLFPGVAAAAAALEPNYLCTYARVTPLHVPYERISLSLPPILRARRIVLQITGETKLALFEAAKRGDESALALPITKLIASWGERLEVWWAP